MNQEKLRVGLIVDSQVVSKYDYEVAEWANNQHNIEISHLIIQALPRNSQKTNLLFRVIKHLKTKGLKSFAENTIWRLIIRIEKARLKRSPLNADHLSNKTLRDVSNLIVVIPNISKSGFVYRYKDEDIQRIRAANIDVLLRCGSGILLGDILTVCPFGVISFHHADNRVNRGVPPGFWEVYYNEAQTGFIIQRLTDELDGGEVLFRGAFPTANYYLCNQANIYCRSNHYLKELLNSLATFRKLPEAEPRFPYSYKLFRAPTLAVQANYLLRTISSSLKSRIRYKVAPRQNRWSVAFQRRHWRDLVMWKATRIVNPRNRFLADPFVISKNEGDYCFVEDYDFSSKRGCISVLKLGKSGVESIEKVISEPFHMSFPYIFEYDGKLLMVPETCENKDIRVYECVDFPSRWAFRKVLMDGVSAADSMIFLKDELWWLFTNINPQGGDDHCSELFIFHSTNPLSTDWTPHPLNPIYIDPSRARNGGILFDGDQIFRVAQKQGFNQYGAESRIFRIDRLDREYFKETLMTEIKPKFFNALGTHHLHSNGKITVFDYLLNEKV